MLEVHGVDLLEQVVGCLGDGLPGHLFTYFGKQMKILQESLGVLVEIILAAGAGLCHEHEHHLPYQAAERILFGRMVPPRVGDLRQLIVNEREQFLNRQPDYSCNIPEALERFFADALSVFT